MWDCPWGRLVCGDRTKGPFFSQAATETTLSCVTKVSVCIAWGADISCLVWRSSNDSTAVHFKLRLSSKNTQGRLMYILSQKLSYKEERVGRIQYFHPSAPDIAVVSNWWLGKLANFWARLYQLLQVVKLSEAILTKGHFSTSTRRQLCTSLRG